MQCAVLLHLEMGAMTQEVNEKTVVVRCRGVASTCQSLSPRKSSKVDVPSFASNPTPVASNATPCTHHSPSELVVLLVARFAAPSGVCSAFLGFRGFAVLWCRSSSFIVRRCPLLVVVRRWPPKFSAALLQHAILGAFLLGTKMANLSKATAKPPAAPPEPPIAAIIS